MKAIAVQIFFISIFLIGHIGVRLYKNEFWPFSTYPMYSKNLELKQFDLLKLYGVQNNEEFSLPIYKNFAPFWDSALYEALNSPKGIENRSVILRKLLERYNLRNEKPIDAIRLYSETYLVSTQLELYKTDPYLNKFKPEKRALVAEVSLVFEN